MGGGQRVLPASWADTLPPSLIHPTGACVPTTPRGAFCRRGFSFLCRGQGRPRMGNPLRSQAGVLGTASPPELLRLHTSRGGLSGMGAVTIIRLVTSPAPRQALLLACPLTHPSASFVLGACSVLHGWVWGRGFVLCCLEVQFQKFRISPGGAYLVPLWEDCHSLQAWCSQAHQVRSPPQAECSLHPQAPLVLQPGEDSPKSPQGQEGL